MAVRFGARVAELRRVVVSDAVSRQRATDGHEAVDTRSSQVQAWLRVGILLFKC